MPLPISPLATGSVEIGGQTVGYRSLSRAEALKLNDYQGRADDAELFLLVTSTGCTEDEARAFREGNDLKTAGLLIDGILILSGLAIRDDDGDVLPKARTSSKSSNGR
jgi:hypothetical protein